MNGYDHRTGLDFEKMHGLGNDFVIIDARGRADPMSPALARAIGDRHRGVGFDQLAVIFEDDSADARLIFWNADGSTAGACGNATRCIAARMMAESGAKRLVLRTERGLLECEAVAGGLIRVDMGPPLLDWQEFRWRGRWTAPRFPSRAPRLPALWATRIALFLLKVPMMRC